jgi:hypothetical protein
MSGRHPHWDDELTERVRTAVSQCRDVDGGPIDDHDLFDVIATVEDWQEQRYWNDSDVTSRMLWDAAQREADKSTGSSDEKFVRLLWMAQILAAIETAEAMVAR